MASEWKDSRPMSPHLHVWRWHGSMASSILHRACAIISYAGLIKVSIGLFILAKTGKLPFENLIFSPLGAIGVFIFLFALIFLAFAQLRHAIWDRGNMFDPKTNNILSYFMIVLALLIATLATYAFVGNY